MDEDDNTVWEEHVTCEECGMCGDACCMEQEP